MQTMDEESIPPLNSAITGVSERSRRGTDWAKTDRKCSSYSESVEYRIFLLGSKCQWVVTVLIPLRNCTTHADGTEWIPTNGVRWDSGNHESQPPIYSSS